MVSLREILELPALQGTRLHGAAAASMREVRWLATVQNISCTGICLQVSRRFDRGTVLAVEIEGVASSRPRRLLARVGRVDVRGPRQWLIGCKFLRPLSEEAVREPRKQKTPERQQL